MEEPVQTSCVDSELGGSRGREPVCLEDLGSRDQTGTGGGFGFLF